MDNDISAIRRRCRRSPTFLGRISRFHDFQCDEFVSNPCVFRCCARWSRRLKAVLWLTGRLRHLPTACSDSRWFSIKACEAAGSRFAQN